MAGLFPGICNAQNVDANGQPLANAVLTVFQGGTDALASVFQDIGLAIPGQNPMTADITGRNPLFYVADGVYKVRLVDQYGVQIYSYPQVASIGASASGGGGSAVDPTTIFQTGDELFQKVNIPRTGWVRQNGQTIGSATSGASERANADCQALFLFLWNNYPNGACPVVGGRGASAAADWAASKQLTLYDMRARNAAGLDGMGNARAGLIPDNSILSTISGGHDTADTPGAFGGAANSFITQPYLPNINFAVTIPAGQGSHQHSTDGNLGGVGTNGGPLQAIGVAGANNTAVATLPQMTGTAASGGGGVAFPTMAPFAIGTWYVKL